MEVIRQHIYTIGYYWEAERLFELITTRALMPHWLSSWPLSGHSLCESNATLANVLERLMAAAQHPTLTVHSFLLILS